MRRVNPVEVAALAIALVATFAQMAWHRRFIHDDAFISLRYARNWVEHGELAWNLGERIEGYTNFFHLALTAGALQVGFHATTAVRVINALGALLLLASTAIGLRVLLPHRGQSFARAAILVSVAATPSLAIWILGGLEAVLVAGLLTVGLVALLLASEHRSTRLSATFSSLAFSLAVLTRLDSAVFIVGAAMAVLFWGASSRRERLLLAVATVGMPALTAFVHLAWRLSFYGEILPMTFYAKTGVDFVVRIGAVPLFLGLSVPYNPVLWLSLLVAAVQAARRQVGPRQRLLLTPLLFQLSYVLWSGGDHMPGARVLVPLTGASALLIAEGVSRAPKLTWIVPGVCLGAVVIASVLVPQRRMDDAAFAGTLVGRTIAELWPSDSVVALHTAGSTPFHANSMRFIDMFGLNDPVIAKRRDVPLLTYWQRIPGHAKGDGAYVLERRPDFIIAGPAEGTRIDKPWFLSDVEIARLEEFAECYRLRTKEIPYSDAVAARARPRPNPLVFTYYERACP